MGIHDSLRHSHVVERERVNHTARVSNQDLNGGVVGSDHEQRVVDENERNVGNEIPWSVHFLECWIVSFLVKIDKAIM